MGGVAGRGVVTTITGIRGQPDDLGDRHDAHVLAHIFAEAKRRHYSIYDFEGFATIGGSIILVTPSTLSYTAT